jgi:DNA-binding NarL/FixJ family response regulator
MNPSQVTALQAEVLALVSKIAVLQAEQAAQSRNVLPNLPIVIRDKYRNSPTLKCDRGAIPLKDLHRAREEFDRLPAVRCSRTHGWLTLAERLAIVAFWANGIAAKEIAKKYDVSAATISNRVRAYYFSQAE